MRVALVVHDFNHILANGCIQNAYFIYLALRYLDIDVNFVFQTEVTEPILFAHGMLGPIYATQLRLENIHEYQMIIGTTNLLHTCMIDRARELGVITVQTICGASYMIDQMEFVGSNISEGFGDVFNGRVDELWVQNGMSAYTDYFEALSKKPAFVIPNFWNMAIMTKMQGDKPLPFFIDTGHKGVAADILIMESNIMISKTAVIPLVTCERLFTIAPDRIMEVFVFCYPDTPRVHDMCSRLELDKSGKLKKFTRLVNTEIFSTFAHSRYPVVFLSHTQQCPLNYAHFEILWLGFPLVHNSEYLRILGLGFFYAGDSVSAASDQILLALDTFKGEVAAEARRRAQKILRDAFDPESPIASAHLKTILDGAFARRK
jgi:hypothetical protein